MADIFHIAVLVLLTAYPAYRLFRNRNASSAVMLIAFWCSALVLGLDGQAVRSPEAFLVWKGAGLYAEALLCPVWIAFSLCYARHFSLREISVTQRAAFVLSFIPVAIVAAYPVRAFLFAPDFAYEKVLFLEPLAFFFYLQIMLFLAIALFNLEATIANASHGVRWKVKFAVVGAGAMAMSFILYFSQSLLFRSLDMGFMTVRFGALAFGALLVAYSEVERGAEERIVISRSLTYRSFVLLLAALFLVGVGIMGEGMKLFGKSFNQYMLTGTGFAACVALVLLVLSEGLRRKLRVLVQRNFYGEKYDYRVEWDAFTERISSARSRDELFKNILIAFCETFGVVGGAIFMRGRHSRNFLPVCFHEMDPAEAFFCSDGRLALRMAQERAVLDLRREGTDIDAGEARFLKEAEARFIIPACAGDQMLALLVLGRPINMAEQYDEEDMALMGALSRQVAVVFKNLRLGDELAEARDMEAFGKVAAFLLHDLKNQVYPLGLLTENAREYINEPEFQKDMLDSLEGVVARMKALIRQLTHIPANPALDMRPVDLLELARKTADSLPEKTVRIFGEPVIVRADAEEMRKVLLNLYLNAFEAGTGAPFDVHVGCEKQPYVKVVDYGKGIDETVLRDGLFVPFRTTKEKGLGIGLFQSKQIVEAHGGTLNVTNVAGKGATFWVNLPR